MKKTWITLLAVASSFTVATSAFAYDSQVERDRAQLRADTARLQQERVELRQAQAREGYARQTGHPVKAWIAEKQVRREASEVRAAQQQVYRDRAQLARDRGW